MAATVTEKALKAPAPKAGPWTTASEPALLWRPDVDGKNVSPLNKCTFYSLLRKVPFPFCQDGKWQNESFMCGCKRFTASSLKRSWTAMC